MKKDNIEVTCRLGYPGLVNKDLEFALGQEAVDMGWKLRGSYSNGNVNYIDFKKTQRGFHEIKR